LPQSVGGVGYLPAEFLIGRADRIIFSRRGAAVLFLDLAADRFFKGSMRTGE
jgi:signal peptidase I